MTQEQREATRDLQRFLRAISYHDPHVPAPPIDGVFESATETALRAFQDREGLPVNGVADKTTWDRLVSAYRQTQASAHAPHRPALFPRLPEDHAMHAGDEGILVRVLQFLLAETAVLYGESVRAEQSGVFDEGTAAAVRAFQKIRGLPEAGDVDRKTWNALVDSYNRLFGGYFPQ